MLQLSDLHLSPKVEISYLTSLMKKINEKDVDLVFITGDIIETSPKKLHKQLEKFREINAPTYYITGNHDIFYGHEELKEILEKNDVICLDNKSTIIPIKNKSLQLVGISDRYSFMKKIKRPIKDLFDSLDKELFTILLAHQPKDCEHIKDTRIDLQLSGHTHGGQVFPFTLFVKLLQPYFKGLYTHNKTLLYVTKGLGYWGVGFRYKAKSEIPIFTIN
ncbi:MAG: metallophosphoesterase [Sulfurimonas sp.]|nr:metallophosphoesterase [Sulfurimonas sp.]